MRYFFRLALFIVIIMLVMVACENDPVKANTINVNNSITVNFEDLYQNNINTDSLIVTLSGDDLDDTFSFTDLASSQKLEFAFSTELGENLTIGITLYFNESVKSTYSQYWINKDNEDGRVGELTATYYHGNIILKLDTNPLEEVTATDFYNYTVLDKFFKEYKIENVDAIADEFCTTPMKFLTEHRVLYEILDENMIPVVQYPFGAYYNPVATCSNAFGCYDQYINTNNQEFLDWFYINADWIIDYKDSDSLLRYEFDFTHETVSLQAGWTSAMAQGQALALMCIAYHNCGDTKYLHAADDFFVTMHTNTESAWNVYIDDEDYLWYEEYPSEDFCHVLNGKLFGMWGLWDYYCITRNPDALRLLQGGIASILDNYPLWDVDGVDGSHYCCHTTSISSYHRIHKLQFAAYRDMFNIEEFDTIINTFTNARND